MKGQRRFILDTNLLISRLLFPTSIPGQAAQKAIQQGELLFSDATLQELAEVLSRPKFDRYLTLQDRQEFFALLSRLAFRVHIVRLVAACRDPKDNAVLEVAVNGHADAIITGDEDLVLLNPFAGIPVLSPRKFLEHKDY